MRTYWMAFCNDGVELFGIERSTRAEAINDLKEAFRFDYAESPEGVAYNDYYIEEYHESPSLIVIGKREYFKMTMGKRGGVRCEKTRAI